MLQNCPKWSTIVQNNPNSLKQSKMVQNFLNLSNGLKLSKMVHYGPIWSNLVQNSAKCSNMVQYCLKQFIMVQKVQNVPKWSKVVQYRPNLSKLPSQNDRSLCNISWGNSS